MGHHHINTADVDASKHFWSLLGATPVPFGDYPVMRLPDLLIFLRQQAPTGRKPGNDGESCRSETQGRAHPKSNRSNSRGSRSSPGRSWPDAKEDVYFNEPRRRYIAFLLSPGRNEGRALRRQDESRAGGESSHSFLRSRRRRDEGLVRRRTSAPHPASAGAWRRLSFPA